MQPMALNRFREKFKIFIWFIFLYGFFIQCRAQKCASPNITNNEFEYGFTFKEALSLNFSGVIESFLMTGTERIYDTSNNNWLVNYIDARYARGVLEVYTTPNFKKYVEEQSSSRINLAITLVCEDQSRPILIFRINIKRENLYEPTFTKPFYDITIPLPLYKGFDLTTFEQISARDIDIFDNKVTFSTNYTGLVEVKTKPDTDEDGKTFYAMLILTAPLVSLSKPLEFFITAMDSGQPARFSSAKVRLSADETITFIHPPKFEKNLYIGELNDTLALNVEAPVLTFETWTADVKFAKEGNDADLFTLTPSNNRIQIKLSRILTDADVEDRSFLSFVLVAIRSDDMTGSCSVVIEIPQKSTGPGSSTCPPCIAPTSETCVQPTTSDPSSAPIFDRKLYLYRIQPLYLGVIGALSAKIPGSSDRVIYSLDVSNDHLKPRLSLQQSSGQIAVNELVSPGLYTFQAVATNPTSGAKGYARVRLAVDTAMTCPNGTTVVSSSLLVKHIAEEKVHMDLLNARYGRCLFTIFSMEPNDRGYVTIDNRTSQLTTIAIDREDKVFEAMLVPQIIVQLKLNCPDATNIRNRRALPSEYASMEDSKSLILTDDIPFNPLLTTLTLIIEDINDNSPEFIFPPKNGYVVGYPEVDVYYNLMPEYLVKVEAKDRDTGLNAKIRYSLVENDFFQIDPDSGTIYPLAKSTKPFKSMELTVIAKDRDGAYNGRSTKIIIMVKLLLSSSLTLLTLNDQTSRNLESILKDVSQSIDGNVYGVRYAMLPARTIQEEEEAQYGRADNTVLNKAERQMMLRVWIYVIDAQGDFVEGVDVERKLENLRDKFNFETSPYGTMTENEALSVDAVGLIAGISVLGVLLLASIAGAVIFWWIWLRPYNFKSISNETTSETISSEGSLENEVKYKAGNSYYYEDGEAYDPKNYKKRASMPISGVTHVDTSDESNTNSLEGGYSNNSDNSDGSRGQNERRKSIVTFNELVERIDIEVNDNNFRHHGSSMNDDERL